MPEKRRSPRLPLEESVSIVLFRTGPQASFSSERILTETIDVSASGMRIRTDEAIDNDRVFDICVELRGYTKRYLLTGESRWCRYIAEREVFEVGIEIRFGEGTDFMEWSELVSKLGER
jgi:hypothetical protein